ncbi:hypothetical protein BDQ17DRAFT_471152 [Cyathus striatus]|nr:hypothetical protein BDQ17DRAFT_471152 [Cyathus striatus]
MSTPYPDLPIGTPLYPSIGPTFGIIIIAVVISSFLTGILTLQLYNYYILFPKDATIRKWSVAAIYVLDIGQFACICDFCWWYLVRNWGNMNALGVVRPSFGTFVIFGSIVIVIVKISFLQRIHALDKKLNIFCIIMLFFIIVEFVFAMIGSTYGLKPITFAEATSGKFNQAVAGIWLSSGVLVDICITTVLSLSLRRRRTGFRRCDNLITKLTVFSVNTCLLTSVVSILDIISFYKLDVFQNAHIVCNMLLCRLFSNSLLASYNRRADFRGNDDVSTNTSGSHGPGIIIHTRTEQMSDQHGIHSGQAHVVRSDRKADVNWNDMEMFPVAKGSGGP